MKKIFKYTLRKELGEWVTDMPKTIQVLRMGEVHDKYYDGTFLWGIVDTDAPNVTQIVDYIPTPKASFDERLYGRYNLAIKEKQEVKYLRPEAIVGVNDVDGFLRIYYNPFANHVFGITKLAFYKTGQEIDVPIERLKYIGFCNMYIMQELCIYVFQIF